MSSPILPRMNYEPWRAVAFYLVLAFGFGWLIFRLFGLQVLEFAAWKAQAEDNRTRAISVQPSRGIIYDRRGFILAGNVASFNIIITPANLPDDPADIQEIYRRLSDLTDIPVNSGTVEDATKISECVPGPGIAQWVDLGNSLAPYTPVRIDCNVSEELARTVSEKAVDWPGVGVEIQPIRDYPTGSLTSDVIGFLGPIPASVEAFYTERGFLPNRDKVGYSGVEAYFDNLLLGRPGKSIVEVDVAGQVLRNLEPPIKPQSGNNLILTIDTRLQKAAETALVGDIDYWNLRAQRILISSGSVIAMNPKTGEILAMVSYPSYENNRMARFIPDYYYKQLVQDPRKPLLNHAISNVYPPGSVYKLATAIGVLNEGLVTPSSVFLTPGELLITESFSPNGLKTQRSYRDWIFNTNPAGFGQLNFLQCIAYSSDVCFYKLGGGYQTEVPEGLDIERISQYARALGYGEKSGIELLGESKGLVPENFPQWKRINQGENWSRGDTYISTIGQGYVGSTPLQVLISGAVIANDGKMMQPTLVREITDSNGKVIPVWRDDTGNLFEQIMDANGKTTWRDESGKLLNEIPQGSWQISPFQGHMKWDLTVDKMIKNFECEANYCTDTGSLKSIQLSAIKSVQEGMRLTVSDPQGTLKDYFVDMPIVVAGKTGTAEYCDDVARAANRCIPGRWPAHAWTVAYAPYDDPEIVVVAFAYNGNEGSTVAAPMIEKIMKAYFCLKSVDLNPNPSNGCE